MVLQKNQNPDPGATLPRNQRAKKNLFRGHFETYLKTHFVASWSFWLNWVETELRGKELCPYSARCKAPRVYRCIPHRGERKKRCAKMGAGCENDLQKYFFYAWFLGWVAPDSGFGFFVDQHRDGCHKPGFVTRMHMLLSSWTYLHRAQPMLCLGQA